MNKAAVLAIFVAALILGAFVARSLVTASTTTVSITPIGGLFVVSANYPTNATFLGLTAGHLGQIYGVSLGSTVNSTSINFVVYQNYGLANQTIIRTAATALRGPMAGGLSSYRIYLDLGSSSIGSPLYISTKWSVS